MGAIVIRTRYDEGTESAEVATNGVGGGGGGANPRPPTAFSLSRVGMYESINSLFLCRNFKTTIYHQTVTNNYLLRCVIIGSTGILYVIQLSDRVYNVTFPA